MADAGFPKKFGLKQAKSAQNGPRTEISWVFLKFCFYFLLEISENERSFNSLFSRLNSISGKCYLLSYMPEIFHPIRLQDSLIVSISGRKASISLIVLYGYIHQGKVTFETITFVWVCPGMASHPQSCLDWLWVPYLDLSFKIVHNERFIRIHEIYNLWRQCALVQSDCGILWWSMPLDGIRQGLRFFV